MHGYPRTDTVVEENGHVGHGAVLHGCTLRRNVMIGMNAVIMDEVEIGESSIIAASSFVKARMIVPSRVLVAGVPGRIVRALTDEEVARKTQGTASYQRLAQRSLATMECVDALPAVELHRGRVKW